MVLFFYQWIVMFMYIIKWLEPKVEQYTSGNIILGAGYSGDMQQVTSNRCYNATVSSTSEQHAYIQLGTAISFSELEDKLGVYISISGKFWMFAADAKVSYMKSLQDKDYTISLNYYYYSSQKVAVQVGYGNKALTEDGKDFYQDGKNLYFGLICGDYYIDSYLEGALLSMGLNIKLSSSDAKKKFNEKAGATYGNIISALESVSSIATNNSITGSITIQAFQMGGEPSKLSNILSEDSTGNYYALTCSITAIDSCIKTASGLLAYAKHNFPNQFSFEKNMGLTSLGIAFSSYKPVKLLGLTPPASLVTREVKQYRNELSNKLKENEYYQEKLYPFFNDAYPVELDDAFIKNATLVLSKANHNIRMLMQQHEGAADCFNLPYKCKSIKDSIDSQLENIKVSDLKFLKDIKYTITSFDGKGILYNTGGGRGESWKVVPTIDSGSTVVVDDVYAKDKDYRYVGSYIDLLYELPMHFLGNLTKDRWGKEFYFGNLCTEIDVTHGWHNCHPHTETKQLSSFFFEPYSNSNILLTSTINDFDNV